MAKRGATFAVEVEGLSETLKALRGVQRDLRMSANGEIRDAAGRCSEELVGYLSSSASSSGVPVAPRVARSLKVKRDRFPSVSVGGTMRVGRGGAIAAKLLWGSEHGPATMPNRFAVAPGAGYWIAPAVARFKQGPAVSTFTAAITRVFRRYGLL